jgi:hypothetical protein
MNNEEREGLLFTEGIAREELLTAKDIQFRYGFSFWEIIGIPEFPKYHFGRNGQCMYLKKDVEAFFEENENLLKGKNENE